MVHGVDQYWLQFLIFNLLWLCQHEPEVCLVATLEFLEHLAAWLIGNTYTGLVSFIKIPPLM